MPTPIQMQRVCIYVGGKQLVPFFTENLEGRGNCNKTSLRTRVTLVENKVVKMS